MQVTIGVGRTVVVYDDVDPFDINTPSKYICGDQDALLEGLERSVAINAGFCQPCTH